jgi:uncharacterized protein YodC (DUF2158 family)
MIIPAVTEQSIQVGDVVVALNGGPEMTVQARSQNLAYCAWLVEGRLHQGTFEVASLRRLRGAGPAPKAGGAPDSGPAGP